jgi:UTP--glucose-1-phosphate uridylyltransferase
VQTEIRILPVNSKAENAPSRRFQLTDATIELAKTQPFYGLEFKGRSFDCGSKVGFLAANVAYALARDDLAADVRAELKRLLGEG